MYNYEYHTCFKVSYKGIACQKNPFDYVIYQMLIFSLRPDLIIEIGTNKGGSALYLSDLVFDWQGHVHSIDINPVPDNIWHPALTFFTGGYQSYDLELTKQFKKIMVIDDGSHLYDDVINTLNKFSPVVSKGSYFIVEDTNEVLQARHAVNDFLSTNKEYVVDRTMCDFFGYNCTANFDSFLIKS